MMRKQVLRATPAVSTSPRILRVARVCPAARVAVERRERRFVWVDRRRADARFPNSANIRCQA
jgi:hypothetical protein